MVGNVNVVGAVRTQSLWSRVGIKPNGSVEVMKRNYAHAYLSVPRILSRVALMSVFISAAGVTGDPVTDFIGEMATFTCIPAFALGLLYKSEGRRSLALASLVAGALRVGASFHVGLFPGSIFSVVNEIGGMVRSRLAISNNRQAFREQLAGLSGRQAEPSTIAEKIVHPTYMPRILGRRGRNRFQMDYLDMLASVNRDKCHDTLAYLYATSQTNQEVKAMRSLVNRLSRAAQAKNWFTRFIFLSRYLSPETKQLVLETLGPYKSAG